VDIVLLLVVVVATVNVGLGFALAVYLARRYRMLVASGIDDLARLADAGRFDGNRTSPPGGVEIDGKPESPQL
jgi:hypothetical protein